VDHVLSSMDEMYQQDAAWANTHIGLNPMDWVRPLSRVVLSGIKGTRDAHASGESDEWLWCKALGLPQSPKWTLVHSNQLDQGVVQYLGICQTPFRHFLDTFLFNLCHFCVTLVTPQMTLLNSV